jgi:hypothetical protein
LEGGIALAEFADLARWGGHGSALPPVSPRFNLQEVENESAEAPPLHEGNEPQPISALVCIIEYGGSPRLITCRRFDVKSSVGYVGAICHAANGYRQFRYDRISGVFDATTGEILGSGSYFDRFQADSETERAYSWGLTSSRKATLVAGLNVLAFMARCDGHWHPLETEVIESFVCSMWLRKEWEGEPEIKEIIAHSQRLSPDADIFFRALRSYASSNTSTRIICRAISDLIAADGIICEQETNWGAEVDAFFREYSEEEFARHFL